MESFGLFCGFNSIGRTSDGSNVIAGAAVNLGARGAAFVGNVVEASGGDTSPLVTLWADGNTNTAKNILLQMNTTVGARANLIYQDTGSTTIAKTAYVQANVFWERNTKSDVFGTNGNLTGNWSDRFQVAWWGNAMIDGDTAGSTAPGIGHWIGEVAELYGAMGYPGAQLDPDFADDQSYHGGNAGGGDYTPGPSTELPLIPAGRAAYPFDQAGRPVANDGTGLAGALQPL